MLFRFIFFYFRCGPESQLLFLLPCSIEYKHNTKPPVLDCRREKRHTNKLSLLAGTRKGEKSTAAMANKVFAVPIFLVVFRESLEAVIIVSILLAFLKKTLGGPGGDVKAYKKLCKQVCTGGFLPLIIVPDAAHRQHGFT